MLMALIVAAAIQSSSAPVEPASVADFELICFCSARVGTPHGIVHMDNNGQILKIARNPLTKAEMIAQGVPVLDSQLRVLRDWDLLQRNGDKFVTKIGVLGPAQMEALRSRLRPQVEAVIQASTIPMAAIIADLRKRHRVESAHAVLFSYILDGLLWESLGNAGKIASLAPTIEHPMWNGIFWAVYPKPASSPGTDSSRFGNADLRMMWKPGTADLWGPLVSEVNVQEWLKAVGNTPVDQAFPKSPAQTPFQDPLIIDERANDPIFLNGEQIAQVTAQALKGTKLDDLMPFQSADERLVIAAHEFIWLVLDELARRPDFAEPAVLRHGTKNTADLAPLLVVAVKADSSSAH